MQNNLFSKFNDRGYIFQCTNVENIEALLNKSNIKFYIGFDCKNLKLIEQLQK